VSRVPVACGPGALASPAATYWRASGGGAGAESKHAGSHESNDDTSSPPRRLDVDPSAAAAHRCGDGTVAEDPPHAENGLLEVTINDARS
jgi:hypothetical protein